MVAQEGPRWVLLSYRIPREPSTPRIAVWRKLNDLGVAKIGEGLVALPNHPRTREHLEWVASAVQDADGHAIVWLADTATRRSGQDVAADMTHAREAEYQTLVAEVTGAAEPGGRAISRWRRTWRRIDRRDYFGAPSRDRARLAIAERAERQDRAGRSS